MRSSPDDDAVPVGDRLATATAADPRLTHALAGRLEDVVELWESLGPDGPAFGATVDPEPSRARAGYYLPLARMLLQSLEGSAVHRATYLDTRLNYLPKGLSGAERAALLGRMLDAEHARIAELLCDTCPADLTVAALAALHRPLVSAPQAGDPRVLFIGDCVFNDVRMFLSDRVVRRTGRGLDADHVFFDAGPQPLSVDEVRRITADAPPTAIGLSLFSYGGVPAYQALTAELGRLSRRGLRERVRGLADLVAASVAAIREVTDAPVLVHTSSSLPIPRRRARLRFMPVEQRGRRRLNREVTAVVSEVVGATENTVLVDEQQLIARYGGLRAIGAELLGPEYAEAYAHPAAFGAALADVYDEMLTAADLLGAAKVLLVDFDNTLWSGVMAEGPVEHHHERQRLLRELKDAGVLLVALSKNEPASIRWDEMELAPDDFVLRLIDWRPKPDTVAEAIAALDLAPSAFVLLDDNPAERALVQENVRGVRALDSLREESWRALELWLELPSTTRTAEARRRTELYQEAVARREAMGEVHDYAEMMRSLELRAEVRPATDADRERLLELTQRTNQFNTTTLRHTADQLAELRASADHEVLVASLADRFGDLGVVALAIVASHSVDEVELEAFVMSCRAMGFGLERYVLADVRRRHPGARLLGPFSPTERNQPAARLYPSNGFTERAPGTWVLDADTPLHSPEWFDAAASAT